MPAKPKYFTVSVLLPLAAKDIISPKSKIRII